MQNLKKYICVFIIVLFMFMIGFIIGKVLIKSDEKNEKSVQNIEQNIISNDEQKIDTSYIIEKNEISTTGLYNKPGQVYTSSEDDLMLNDMKFDNSNSLYYKIITSMENYNMYYEREMDIPKLTEDDFEKYLITSNLNLKREE